MTAAQIAAFGRLARLRMTPEALWVAIGQASAFAGGLATIKAASASLSPAEYGRQAAALAIVGLLQVALFGAISQTATRYLTVAIERLQLQIYGFLLCWMACGAVFVVGILSLSIGFVDVPAVVPLPVMMTCACAVLGGAQMVGMAVANAARNRRLVSKLQAVEAFLRPGLIVAFTWVEPTALAAVAAYLTTSVLIVGVLAAVLWREMKRQKSLPQWSIATHLESSLTSKMLRFTVPFIAFGVLGAVGSHGERLILADSLSWSEVGVYALLSQVAMAPNLLFSTIVNQYYYPIVYQSRDDRGLKAYLLLSFSGLMAIACVLALLGPVLVVLFSNERFSGHEHLLLYLGGAAGLFNVGQQLTLRGFRADKPSIYISAKLVHSAALLVSAQLLLPSWGMDGMAMASLLAAAAYVVAVVIANTQLDRQDSPGGTAALTAT